MWCHKDWTLTQRNCLRLYQRMIVLFLSTGAFQHHAQTAGGWSLLKEPPKKKLGGQPAARCFSIFYKFKRSATVTSKWTLSTPLGLLLEMEAGTRQKLDTTGGRRGVCVNSGGATASILFHNQTIKTLILTSVCFVRCAVVNTQLAHLCRDCSSSSIGWN